MTPGPSRSRRERPSEAGRSRLRCAAPAASSFDSRLGPDRMLTRRALLTLPVAFAIGRALREALDIRAVDRTRILRAARHYLRESPATITSFPSPRSAGGPHDYFSEGDYWWPDPANP